MKFDKDVVRKDRLALVHELEAAGARLLLDTPADLLRYASADDSRSGDSRREARPES